MQFITVTSNVLWYGISISLFIGSIIALIMNQIGAAAPRTHHLLSYIDSFVSHDEVKYSTHQVCMHIYMYVIFTFLLIFPSIIFLYVYGLILSKTLRFLSPFHAALLHVCMYACTYVCIRRRWSVLYCTDCAFLGTIVSYQLDIVLRCALSWLQDMRVWMVDRKYLTARTYDRVQRIYRYD